MNILVLGIGNAQVDLLRWLNSEYTVHKLSYTPEGRGRKYADYFQVIDIKDKEAVLTYADNNSVDIVCSIGSDLGMQTSAWVSHRLQLPTFVTPAIADVCAAKHKLRKELEGFWGSIPYTVLTNTEEMNGLSYPCIIKPVDSQGQRGVYKVGNASDLAHKFPLSREYSSANIIIAEEFVEGPEVSVNIYLTDGEIVFSAISDRMVWPGLPGGLIHKHRFPSQYANNNDRKRILELTKEVTERLGIANGPVYFQIKLPPDSDPKVIEVTPRLDGCHLWRLIRFATGVDLLSLSWKHLVHNNFSVPEPKECDTTWILEFMCDKPGEAVNYDHYDFENARYSEWYYKEGEVVKPLNTFMEKCGYQIYQI